MLPGPYYIATSESRQWNILMFPLQVLSRPVLVTSLIPTETSKLESYVWMIAVSVAAFLLVLLVITCLFCRWKNGRPGEKKTVITKDHIQRVDLPFKADLELKELRVRFDIINVCFPQISHVF